MQFFCEFHENIKTLYLTVTLPSAANELTSLDIYDRKTLRLRHAFQTYSIALPASVDPAARLNINSDGLQLTSRFKAGAILSSTNINNVPFHSPQTLRQDLKCKECDQVLIHGHDLKWSFMPSENWTEMMDSWHCHRGVSDEHHHEHHDQYTLPDHIVSAAERIRARPGRGLVGLSYLLVHRDDVLSNKVDWSSNVCKTCQSRKDSLDDDEHKFQKKDLVVDNDEQVNSLVYVVANMLNKLDLQAVHRFTLSVKGNAGTKLDDSKSNESNISLWIMTPDARITATDLCNESPGMRVMKVMYRFNVSEMHEEPDGQDGQDEEHIEVEQQDFSLLKERLTVHHHRTGQEKFKTWSSSFLQRYESDAHRDTISNQ